ncbi:MAG: hypothetical protein J6T84_01330 [Spirochaetaceae bacterium]|nr:hypothetical protein [Spirochaetaceae bacterium]
MQEENDGQAEMPYMLPNWRINEIILIAVRFLTEEGYSENNFDYKKVISSKGIVIKGYSTFSPENLKELQKVSLSLWDEGLCLVFPDRDKGGSCCMIAFNDKKNMTETMKIILHEFAHIKLHHTEQSPNAEAEAMLFSEAVLFLMISEKNHRKKLKVALSERKRRLFERIKARLIKNLICKEVV